MPNADDVPGIAPTLAVTPVGPKEFALWDSGTWDHAVWGF